MSLDLDIRISRQEPGAMLDVPIFIEDIPALNQ